MYSSSWCQCVNFPDTFHRIFNVWETPEIRNGRKKINDWAIEYESVPYISVSHLQLKMKWNAFASIRCASCFVQFKNKIKIMIKLHNSMERIIFSAEQSHFVWVYAGTASFTFTASPIARLRACGRFAWPYRLQDKWHPLFRPFCLISQYYRLSQGVVHQCIQCIVIFGSIWCLTNLLIVIHTHYSIRWPWIHWTGCDWMKNLHLKLYWMRWVEHMLFVYIKFHNIENEMMANLFTTLLALPFLLCKNTELRRERESYEYQPQ